MNVNHQQYIYERIIHIPKGNRDKRGHYDLPIHCFIIHNIIGIHVLAINIHSHFQIYKIWIG